MEIKALPKQPPIFISYLRVGRLLYYSLILFILESWFFWSLLKKAMAREDRLLIIIWGVCFLFSFVHIFLVTMDGWSRFQNYKRAKDQFYKFGFNRRIANFYIGSKCQRNAAIVAADELGYAKEIRLHYKRSGVKWYHYIPYFMIKDPLFFFRKAFWSRTFLEKNYKPKYDYHKLQLELQA